MKNKSLTNPITKLSQKELELEAKKSYDLLLNNPEKFKELVRKNMPEFIREMDTKEDMASSMMESGQEFLLIVYDTLRRYHGFNDEQLKEFRDHLGDVLTGAKEFEDAGLNMIGAYTTKVLGEKVQQIGIGGLLAEIAEIRYKKERIRKMGLETPILPEAMPLLKELEKRNRQKK